MGIMQAQIHNKSGLVFLFQVPFRLTRMLVRAMEVSGIEGNFRFTCENVVQVLRSNTDSVMAMMEVHLIIEILVQFMNTWVTLDLICIYIPKS